jgi:hypothetical protein
MSLKLEDVEFRNEDSFIKYVIMLLQGSTPSSVGESLRDGKHLNIAEKREFAFYAITGAVSVRRAIEPALMRLSLNVRNYIDKHFSLGNRLNFTKIVIAGNLFLEYASDELKLPQVLMNAVRTRFGGRSIFSFNESTSSVSATRKDILKKNADRWKMSDKAVDDTKKSIAIYMATEKESTDTMGKVNIIILPAEVRVLIFTRCNIRKSEKEVYEEVKSFYSYSRHTDLTLITEEKIAIDTKLLYFYFYKNSFNKNYFT